jgi:hypothetical protein
LRRRASRSRRGVASAKASAMTGIPPSGNGITPRTKAYANHTLARQRLRSRSAAPLSFIPNGRWPLLFLSALPVRSHVASAQAEGMRAPFVRHLCTGATVFWLI